MSSRIALFGQISEINDHLYLSGAGVLRPERLKQKSISCVINVTVEEPNANLSGIDYVKIRVEDSPYSRLDHYFDLVADKIRSIKERGGKTLVHCVAGVSRSATLCIVYLVKHEHMSLRQAYHFVKSARPIIRPNLGFWKQMVDYERQLRGHNTVTLVHVENYPLPFPDVYSNDLRKHILSHPGPPQNDPQIIAAQKRFLQQQQKDGRQPAKTSSGGPTAIGPLKSTIIPIQIVGKRRGLSLIGNSENLRNNRSSPSLLANSSGASTRTDKSSFIGNGTTVNHPHNNSNNHHSSTAAASTAFPWRAVAISPFFSPAPTRRPGGFAGGGGNSGGGHQKLTNGHHHHHFLMGDNGARGLLGKFYGPSLFSAI